MERKTFVDVIKGVAIILVVMQHIGGNLNSGIRLLCKIDVPLFFICSGFLAGAIIRKHHIEDISQYGGIKAALLLVLLIGLGYNFKTTNISFLAHVVGYLAASILAFFFISHYRVRYRMAFDARLHTLADIL